MTIRLRAAFKHARRHDSFSNAETKQNVLSGMGIYIKHSFMGVKIQSHRNSNIYSRIKPREKRFSANPASEYTHKKQPEATYRAGLFWQIETPPRSAKKIQVGQCGWRSYSQVLYTGKSWKRARAEAGKRRFGRLPCRCCRNRSRW